MKKIQNPEARRLYESILPYGNKATAQYIAYGKVLPLDATISEKAAWVNFISRELARVFDENVVKKIRMACRCFLKWGIIEEANIIYQQTECLEEFAQKSNEKLGVCWQVQGEDLFVKYFKCPCPMVNESSELFPLVWCYCTLGYNRDFFEYVFACPVNVHLEKSIKQGDDVCLIRVSKN